MQTGNIADWASDPNTWGPLYPFVGTEMVWVIICIVVWLTWTVWQMRFESATYEKEIAELRKGNNLEKATELYKVSPRPFFSE